MEQIKGRSSIEQVEEFHRVFGHPVANKVGEETLEVRQLRIKLLFEELKELAEATDCKYTFARLCQEYFPENLAWLEDGNNIDHVAELDALCDLQVVLDGKFLTSGHWKVKDEAFAEVHRSNMSKSIVAGSYSKEELDLYITKLEETKGNGMKVQAIIDNAKVIFVREDGKILKGPNFSEPDLKQFVK